MLEGLAIWFLNNYLGKYLEDLEAAQLSISLLAGQVELYDVPLRKDALVKVLNPSMEVKRGVVGHIKLTIPVTSLGTDPWILALHGVTVVVGPSNIPRPRLGKGIPHLEYIHSDVLEEEEEEEEEVVEDVVAPAAPGWFNYGRITIRTIVENLQVRSGDLSSHSTEKCLPAGSDGYQHQIRRL